MASRYRTREEWAALKKKTILFEETAAPGSNDSESQRHDGRKARMREYMRSRREFRDGHPAFAEIDRVKHNEAMRTYRARRRASDPAFAETCRAANRECARRRRAAAGKSRPIEVDET